MCTTQSGFVRWTVALQAPLVHTFTMVNLLFIVAGCLRLDIKVPMASKQQESWGLFQPIL